MNACNQAMINEILVKNSWGVFRGQVSQDNIYEGGLAYFYGFECDIS